MGDGLQELRRVVDFGAVQCGRGKQCERMGCAARRNGDIFNKADVADGGTKDGGPSRGVL